ncbi:MAG TPA: hypothetical protein VF363_08445 [Candidatus Eisenbacteria bacterium]
MHRLRSCFLRIALRAALVVLLVVPAVASGGAPGEGHPLWASIGLGLSPGPYGSDRNGSFVALAGVGRSLSRRAALVGRAAYTRFAAHETTVLSPFSIALRLHLSPVPDLEGGPYVEFGPVVCSASWRGRRAAKTSLLMGAAVGIGTEVPLSGSASLDWGAAFVLTSRAHDVWPDRLTLERGRAGMARGYMYIGLMMRRA